MEKLWDHLASEPAALIGGGFALLVAVVNILYDIWRRREDRKAHWGELERLDLRQDRGQANLVSVAVDDMGFENSRSHYIVVVNEGEEPVTEVRIKSANPNVKIQPLKLDDKNIFWEDSEEELVLGMLRPNSLGNARVEGAASNAGVCPVVRFRLPSGRLFEHRNGYAQPLKED
ncbi:hypothetical protein [Corynebacterium maris]|uniref:hypothetical protein n=1 Tax=Corynebacterium maris TaxID=575200 RepID=UPI0012EC4CCE|nr:hypothetical protein [Corynebacterium maris]